MADDLVAVPRSIARQALAGLMSDVSENDWAAGWMMGTEEGVFAALVGHERGRNWPTAAHWRDQIVPLALALGEWPSPDGDAWVPISDMEAKWGRIVPVVAAVAPVTP